MPDTIRQAGIEAEIAYWRNKLTTLGHRDMSLLEFTPALAPYLPQGQERVSILDVGCGPTFTIGGLHNGKPLDIVGLDPLTDAYSALLKELGIERKYPAYTGLGENLPDYFAEGSFDVVFSKNALDHAQDPYKVIRAMLKVCKDDGMVIFSVFSNEAINTNYSGFHQWNFSKIESNLIFWNHDSAHVLTECINNLPYKIWEKKVTRGRAAQKKMPYKITCVINKIGNNNKNYIKVHDDGLYINYNSKLGTLTLFRDDNFQLQEKLFIHLLHDGQMMEKTSFIWNFQNKMRSMPITAAAFNEICIGQFEKKQTGNKIKKSRIWQKNIQHF